jgi:hypothetical protein
MAPLATINVAQVFRPAAVRLGFARPPAEIHRSG